MRIRMRAGGQSAAKFLHLRTGFIIFEIPDRRLPPIVVSQAEMRLFPSRKPNVSARNSLGIVPSCRSTVEGRRQRFAKQRPPCLFRAFLLHRCCLRPGQDHQPGSRHLAAGPRRSPASLEEGPLPPRSRRDRLRIPRSPDANGDHVRLPAAPLVPKSHRLAYGRTRPCLAAPCLSPILLGRAGGPPTPQSALRARPPASIVLRRTASIRKHKS